MGSFPVRERMGGMEMIGAGGALIVAGIVGLITFFYSLGVEVGKDKASVASRSRASH